MNYVDAIKVDNKIETICCDGRKDSLGHPAVYCIFDKSNEIVCDYCDKKYIRDQNKYR